MKYTFTHDSDGYITCLDFQFDDTLRVGIRSTYVVVNKQVFGIESVNVQELVAVLSGSKNNKYKNILKKLLTFCFKLDTLKYRRH
jgi:hypothetical protein